jgi:hypothetical protein
MTTHRRKYQEKPAPTPAAPYDTSFGVFVNAAGVPVDKDGVALGFKDLKKRDNIKWREALEDTSLQPADLLKAIAFDPRFSINQRMAAAISAAPYFTARKVDGEKGQDLKSPAQRASDIMDAVRAIDTSVGNTPTPTTTSRSRK